MSEHETALVGEATGRRYRLGDAVEVTVERVDRLRGARRPGAGAAPERPRAGTNRSPARRSAGARPPRRRRPAAARRRGR